MKFHVILDRDIKLDEFRRRGEQGIGPRHAMALMIDRLGGAVHFPDLDRDPPSGADRLRCKVFSPAPPIWSLARRLAGELGPDDVVFCSGESTGIPLAAALGGRADGPRVFVLVHNLDRPRGRAAARFARLGRRVAAFGACCSRQYNYLRDGLGVPESRLHLLLEHVDNRFYTPGPPGPDKSRPVIVGTGLENRDYRTLAAATADLDVEVRISGFSAFARGQRRSLPDSLPANMSRRFYEWTELVQLYRDADIVVVPVFPCAYAAGVTTLLEAQACRRPVIASRSPGLSDYTGEADGVTPVEPHDPGALRAAILGLLERPDVAAERAETGYGRIGRDHDFDRSFESLIRIMESI